MVDREPGPRAPETAHDFVGDHQDSVAVQEIADTLQIAIGWDEDPVGAGHRLQDERRNGLRPLELDRLLQLGKGLLG